MTIALVEDEGWVGATYQSLRDVLSQSQPHHADHLLTHWLTSDVESRRSLGAHALGGAGLRRAVPVLLARSADAAETAKVRRTAMFAVGVIGGPQALPGLVRLDPGAELAVVRDDALAMCVGDARDEQVFRTTARHVIEGASTEKCWVYHAIGRRGDKELLPEVLEALHDSSTAVRGDAALALARLSGRDALETILQARNEAATTRERILASLGALHTDATSLADDPELEELREGLASEAYLYRSRTQHDVLAILRASTHRAAAPIADAWEPVFKTASAY
jgi:HEAT repeat protein